MRLQYERDTRETDYNLCRKECGQLTDLWGSSFASNPLAMLESLNFVAAAFWIQLCMPFNISTQANNNFRLFFKWRHALSPPLNTKLRLIRKKTTMKTYSSQNFNTKLTSYVKAKPTSVSYRTKFNSYNSAMPNSNPIKTRTIICLVKSSVTVWAKYHSWWRNSMNCVRWIFKSKTIKLHSSNS